MRTACHLRSAAVLVLIWGRARRRRPAGLMQAVIFAIAACLTGCSSAPAAGGGIRIDVTPMTSVADQPVSIRVSGLTPGTIASLRLRSTDSNGVPWSSSAAFRASPAGTIDPAQSAALSGSYTGVSPMGLFWSMRPGRRAAAGAYFWTAARPLSFEISAAAQGHSPVSVRLSRALSRSALVVRRESLRTAGFYGEFFSAASAPERRPGWWCWAGPRAACPAPWSRRCWPRTATRRWPWRISTRPACRPSCGHPAGIFRRALRWLRAQPQVDPGHVLTLGVSRGSEAALQLGAYYPQLVDGVIGSVPSDVAICSPNNRLTNSTIPAIVGWVETALNHTPNNPNVSILPASRRSD